MKYLRMSISILAIIVIWILWSKGVNNSLIAPSVFQTFEALGNILGEGKSYLYIGGTLLRLAISVLISVGLGMLLGFLSGMFSKALDFLYPIITALRTIPIIAIILIIWMAVGSDNSPLIVTSLILLPISFQAIYEGVIELNKNEFMEAYRLDSRLSMKVIGYVHIPLLIPYIKLALVQSIGLGVKVLVMAEFTSGTSNSIGYAILRANNAIEFDRIFAWTIILIVFVVLIEFFVDRFKKRIEHSN